MEKNKTTLATSLGSNPTIEKNIPDDQVWIDDAFYIKKTMFGLYTSVLKEPFGANFITGATEDGVTQITRWHLKCLQDGTLEDHTYVTGASMGVKL
jgi:hypothetical protein